MLGLTVMPSIETPQPLSGQRVGILGTLASMSRSAAARVCQRAGGQLVHPADATITMLVRGDGANANAALEESLQQVINDGHCEVVSEADFWNLVGLVESDHEVSSLYSPAMLAELIGVPVTVVRRWIRKRYLRPACEVRRLAFFDFPEVAIARRLAALYHHGVSLAAIDSRLAALERQFPLFERPLTELSVLVEGGRLYLRRDGSLAEVSGQRLLPFEADTDLDDEPTATATADVVSQLLAHPSRSGDAPAELRSQALELADAGEVQRAIDVYRSIQLAGRATAEDHFLLAELLYQAGELQAARERYYMTLECDENFVEARINLGCVLAELGDTDLALAALGGALDQHPDFADAHYHLARLQTALGDDVAAAEHWTRFAQLAPDSPWADEARENASEWPK